MKELNREIENFTTIVKDSNSSPSAIERNVEYAFISSARKTRKINLPQIKLQAQMVLVVVLSNIQEKILHKLLKEIF